MNFINKLIRSEETNKKVDEFKAVCRRYEMCQNELKRLAGELYYIRKETLKEILLIKELLLTLRKLPNWCFDDINYSVELIKDFSIAVKYENDPKMFAEYTDQTGRTTAFIGAGTDAGTAIATLGPSTAMSIATVLGTASTGTAISALSGGAATNAALIWLGGGAIVANGIGVVGRTLLLGMFGPIVGSLATIGAFSVKFMNSKKRAEIEKNINTIKHDIQILEPKLARLYELIARSNSNQQKRLRPMISWLKNVSPKDYSQWDDAQKHELEKLINAVSNTAQLINERV